MLCLFLTLIKFEEGEKRSSNHFEPQHIIPLYTSKQELDKMGEKNIWENIEIYDLLLEPVIATQSPSEYH